MLVANAFGLPTIEPAFPTLVGLYGYTEGSCAEGRDFVCNVKDGLWTCRPCDLRQLSAFKELQHTANQLATLFELGRDKLAETDARIGRITSTLVGLVASRLAVRLPAPASVAAAVAAAKSEPTAHETFRKIAQVVPELLSWFTAGVIALKAPLSYPTPPPQPRAGPSGEPPVVIPGPGTGPDTPMPPLPRSRVKSAGIFVGVLGVIAAIALVSTAHYSKKGRRFR